MTAPVAGRAADAGPTVSVIVPAYNAEAYLAGSVEELLRQTFDDFEILVIDDGSSDGTAAIATELADTHAKVRFVRLPENGGVAKARQCGVEESRGVYLWFVDVDDDRNPVALDRLVARARATDADMVVSAAEYVFDRGARRRIPAPPIADTITGLLAFRALLVGSITGHLWNKLVKRDVAVRIEFTSAKVHSDLAMVAQLIAASARVAAIDEVLYSYRLRSGSIVRSGSQRAESLLTVGHAVERAAISLDPAILASMEYRYFTLRYIVLSGMKDAQLGSYSGYERKRLLRLLRGRLGWSWVIVFAARRDARRLAMATAARFSSRLHRALLAKSSERVAGT